ncbi:FAD-binding domain-containing protein [Bacillus sp. FJAT-27245]|uniref:FAD-binding domain-containing protein n=1 Tax=Bacillus sp. FJAT-27245 TaxID=1684144 RepID=UPI0006A77292|nr:FAD-binding domain-containing protein [Bacillus sp. FJAT-27245]
MNIVWYRRDLRVNDHLPLVMAAKYGEVLPLYIIEPSFWQGGILSARHYAFVFESLEELSRRLSELGGCLFVTIGEAVDVFRKLENEYGPIRVFIHKSNELSGSIVGESLKKSGISFEEAPSITAGTATIQSKSNWIKVFEESCELAPPNFRIPKRLPDWLSEPNRKFRKYHVPGELIPMGQPGGERNAEETLHSFIQGRFMRYGRSGEELLKASNDSSRLSPYLAWGNVSLKTVVKKTLGELKEAKTEDARKALHSFLDSLYKRFLAYESGFPGKNGQLFIEGEMWDQDVKERIQSGRTGIPIIDAAVVSLTKTGWLPYSLRAVLAFFLCNGLQLEKQLAKEFLGRLLQDYDPCILDRELELCVSFSGKGMSRYYHPVRVGRKLDSEGAFIKRHIPELARLPAKYVHEPWRYPGFYKLGYPVPVKDPDHLFKTIKLAAEKAGKKRNKNPVRSQEIGEQLSMGLFDD